MANQTDYRPDRHTRANMIAKEIRDLKTGEIIVRAGHTAEEILRSKEKNGKRRFVRVGSEPEGWKRPAPKSAPEPEPEPEEDGALLAEDEPEEEFETQEEASDGKEDGPQGQKGRKKGRS